MQPAPIPDGAPAGTAAYAIRCGDWEEPSGTVYRAPAGTGSAVTGDPAAAARAGWWRAALDHRVVCAEGTPSEILDSLPAHLFAECAFREGGWPYVAVAAASDGALLLGDGIPAALPALEAAIGIAAGRTRPAAEAGTPQDYSAAIRQVEAELGGTLFSTGDLQDYSRLLRLAQYHNYTKDFASSERAYRDALRLHRRLVPDGAAGRAFVLMHIALQLSNQGRFAEAGPLFEQAGSLLGASLDPAERPRFDSYLAIHAANQGQPEHALELARAATRQRLDLAGEGAGQSPHPAAGPAAIGDAVRSLYTEAIMQFVLGDREGAGASLARAERIARRDPDLPPHWQPELYLQQARFAEAAGRPAEAIDLVRRSIEAQAGLYAQSRTEGLAWLLLGKLLWQQGEAADAFNAFRAGFAIIEAQGGGLSFEQALPYFEAVLATVAQQPGRADALLQELFAVSQTIRGSLTAQTIGLAAARLADGEQEISGLIRALQDARMERDTLNTTLLHLQAQPNVLPEQLRQLDRELEAAGARIAALELQVQSVSPRYNQLVDLPIDAGTVQAQLQPDEALVQILVGGDRTLVVLVAPEGLEARLIALNRALALQIVRGLRRPVDEGAGREAFNLPLAHALYRLLFAEIDGRMAAARHVVIVPSEPLLSLPFGMLLTEPPREAGYEDAAWLLRRHALTLAPSVRAFVHIRDVATPSQASRPFIGFGDFQPAGDTAAILAARALPETCRDDAAAVANATPLPATAAELRAAASALDAGAGDLILGAAFTERTVREQRLAEFRVVHFATHGLLPGELDCWSEPGLVVSRPADAQPAEDGILDAAEILDLELDADLVVLSACNTAGAGANTGGESLTGLARAFFYAGARSLLASHWHVPDRPTATLLAGLFREGVAGGRSTAEALRQSQLRLIDDPATAHPYNWAGFTLVGDGGRQL
ncbi:MAG: CHAT domain-containing protein [Alphaproteobacteria bacterium]|nr:CHAT domain-containing protein [Alphaproteobacteria bacterium]